MTVFLYMFPSKLATLESSLPVLTVHVFSYLKSLKPVKQLKLLLAKRKVSTLHAFVSNNYVIQLWFIKNNKTATCHWALHWKCMLKILVSKYITIVIISCFSDKYNFKLTSIQRRWFMYVMNFHERILCKKFAFVDKTTLHVACTIGPTALFRQNN
jgi:hypothetical protein